MLILSFWLWICLSVHRTVTGINSETNLFCLCLSDTHPEIKIWFPDLDTLILCISYIYKQQQKNKAERIPLFNSWDKQLWGTIAVAEAAATPVLMQLLYFWIFTATEVAIAECAMDPSVVGNIILSLTMAKPGCFPQECKCPWSLLSVQGCTMWNPPQPHSPSTQPSKAQNWMTLQRSLPGTFSGKSSAPFVRLQACFALSLF